MLSKLNSLYIKEKNLLKNIWTNHNKLFWRYWIFVLATILISYLAMYVALHFFDADLKKAANGFRQATHSESGESNKDSYWEGTVLLFKNNWMVCLQILILSFIPIRFLYNISIISSSALLGVALGLAQKVGMNMFKSVAFGVLPHSILELSVFIITAIYAGVINKIIVGGILNKFRRNKKTLPSLQEKLKDTFFVFVFVITPSIFIAAIIEGYISRFLLN